jgi:hypothetical protein
MPAQRRLSRCNTLCWNGTGGSRSGAKDIAGVVVFLASARAGYVNGEDICTDDCFGRTLMSLVPPPGFEK